MPAIAVMLVVGGLTMAGAATAAADTPLGSLGINQSVFWSGTFVSSARVQDPSLCGVAGPCFNYRLNVASAGAKVLRVAIETSDDSNDWTVDVLDPSGNVAASGATYESPPIAEDYDREVFVHNPVPGNWNVQVIPTNVENGVFKARAAVQGPSAAPTPIPRAPRVSRPAAKPVATCTRARAKKHRRRAGVPKAKHAARSTCSSKHSRHHRVRRPASAPRSAGSSTPAATGGHAVDMPPDLAADAPWHLTFQQPPPMVVVEGGNYTALAGIHNPTMQAAGQPIYQCLPEETAEQDAHRCLRFTSGFASMGPGKFEVYGSSPTPVAPNGGDLYQRVYRGDGSYYDRKAGQFAFHPIHLHYHVLGIARFDFYQVMPDHSLKVAGQVLKEGFCLGNIKLFDWHVFNQDEVTPTQYPDCEPVAQPDGTWQFHEYITTGWEDSYKWQTSGQYVDFANDPDGYYLLRVTANPDGHLLESDSGHDANNVAYTYMQITGNDIRVIERGRGMSPWDPNKVLLDPVIGEVAP
jgi:Lysyl oxidase